LPELGRLTGRGDPLNLERFFAAKPDLVIDFGTINDTYRSLADRIQSQTDIPYLLIDGRFENIPKHVIFVAEVPKTSNGKIMKQPLKEMLTRDASLQPWNNG
jgi:iron complex transport system substrate-binding protein